MQIEIITKEDLQKLRQDIVNDIKSMLKPSDTRRWLKSTDVRKMLQCSPGTLQNLRMSGHLPYTKIGGSIYYLASDIEQMLEVNRYPPASHK